MIIVDAHLDLAYNALRGRDVLRPASDQPADDEGIPTVGLPDLRAGGIGLICGTVFCEPAMEGKPGYVTPQEAHEAGLRQLNWYARQSDAGQLRIVGSRKELPAGADRGKALATIILLEGADPIRSPDDVPIFAAAGVRIVGLAWRRTRYAGGTGAPGPLSDAGVALVGALDRVGMIHDVSHLSEESFWQLLDLTAGPVMASHSNCRAIVPTDRQLSDEMAKATIRRDGVIGINFFDKFLLSPEEYGTRRARLADVARHVRHFCDLAGDADHVGLGTDMDGGLGREQIPEEIRTSADLASVGEALADAGFRDDDIGAILSGNWLRFFARALPE